MMKKYLLLLTLCLMPLAASAQNYNLQDLDDGALIMNLNASERAEVAQDTLTANLEYTVENADRKIVQNEINSVMEKATDLAKNVQSVRHSTDNYHVYLYSPRPLNGEKDTPSLWRGQQRLTLTSKDSAALLDLAGKLQAMDLNMTGLQYTLSPEKYESVSDGLMDAALDKLQARADAAAKSLGKSSATLIRIDLGGNNNLYQPQPMMMRGMAADAAEMATPVAVPGLTDVTMSVSATALLK